jgi:hypothetical protein
MSDKNPTATHMEEKDLSVTEHSPPVSAFAVLNRAQCVRKFWRLYGAGLGVAVAGLCVSMISLEYSLVLTHSGTLGTQTLSLEVSWQTEGSSTSMERSEIRKLELWH